MAGLSVPGFYYSTDVTPTTGMAAGFEGGVEAARKTLGAEQDAQLKAMQEGRMQRKLPSEIEAAMAAAAQNRAAAQRSNALLPGDVSLQPVQLESLKAQTGKTQADTAATQQTTRQGGIDFSNRQSAVGNLTSPSLSPPNAPATLGAPTALPALPRLEDLPPVTLPDTVPSGGGGGEAIEPPAGLRPPNRDLARIRPVSAGSLQGITAPRPVSAEERRQIWQEFFYTNPPEDGTESGRTPAGPSPSPASPSSPAAPPPPPPAPPAPAASAAGGEAPPAREAAQRVAYNDPIVALQQNYSAMQALRQQHDAIVNTMRYAAATSAAQGQLAGLAAQKAAIEQQYMDRLALHNATTALQSGDTRGVNSALKGTGVEIMRSPDGTFSVYTGGRPTAHTALSYADAAGMIREMFDPAMKALRESQAATAATIAVERGKQDARAAAEIIIEDFKKRNPAAALEVKEANGRVFIIDKQTNTAYEATDAVKNAANKGPMGTPGAATATPIVLPGVRR